MKPASAPAALRVLLADDSALVRQGIRTILTDHPGPRPITIVGEAASYAEAISSAHELRPDVVLLDIRFPDGSGLAACREILRRHPGTAVLVLTSFSNDSLVYEAIAAGALGYLMKEIDPAGLVQALFDVAAGKAIFDAESSARMMRMVRGGGHTSQARELGSLSPQERRVLALVAEGRTNKQIARELGLSDNTVKNYLCNVFDKLQVQRRSQAAALYVQVTGNPSAQAHLGG